MRISYRTTAKFFKINTEHAKGDALRISSIIQKCSIGINEVGADTAGVGGQYEFLISFIRNLSIFGKYA